METSVGFSYAGNAVSATCTKNSTTNIDFKIEDDGIYLSGGELLYQNAVWGDYVKFQIIDIDNILGLGANYVIKEYVSKWYVHPNDTTKVVSTSYGALIPQNLYLRLIYVSTGILTDPKVALNLELHKVI